MAANFSLTSAFSSNDFYMSIPKTSACIFGTITNAICIAVFLSPKMKHESFNYMLAQSVSNFIYLSSLSFQLLYFCSIDAIRQSLAIQLYFVIVFYYLTSVLAIFYILVEIWISFQRYLMLKNKKFLENISYNKIIALVAFFSFIFYTPAFFLYRIFPINVFNNSTQTIQTYYSNEKSEFGQSVAGKMLYISLEILRIFFNSILLPFINVLLMIECKKKELKRTTLIAKYSVASIRKKIYTYFN